MSANNFLVIFRGSVLLAILVAMLLRWCTALYPYSGQGKPPMFGDYEAQRHWMEVTVNLPLKDWYINTTNNDLMYWGLDYPPITAYHSLLCGVVARFVNPNFIRLQTSRGYESYDHKLFMRATVLAADLLIYIPAILWFFSTDNFRRRSMSSEKKSESGNVPVGLCQASNVTSVTFSIFVSLIYPGLILIDYGHFQYNNISLGFFVAAFTAMMQRRDIVGSILFCFAVCYKQMELYHAIPFFCYLLGSCFTKSSLKGISQLLKISMTVILTFGLVWFPFCLNFDILVHVLHRLFPLARGVFEDKVANVWCSLNVFYKLRNTFSNESMAHICLLSTAVAILPSSIDLLLKPTLKKFHVSLINSSLAFFLFSFQVHEKSILLAAVPIVLYFRHDPRACFWFLFVSVFSMLPLLIKDGLVVPTIALMVIFSLTVYLGLNVDVHLQDTKNVKQYVNYTSADKESTQFVTSKASLKPLKSEKQSCSWFLSSSLLNVVFCCSIFACVVLTTCILTLKPPQRYPDLFPLLISVYSCFHFLIFFVYFNFIQILSNLSVIE